MGHLDKETSGSTPPPNRNLTGREPIGGLNSLGGFSASLLTQPGEPERRYPPDYLFLIGFTGSRGPIPSERLLGGRLPPVLFCALMTPRVQPWHRLGTVEPPPFAPTTTGSFVY